jgi:hypothetical protein
MGLAHVTTFQQRDGPGDGRQMRGRKMQARRTIFCDGVLSARATIFRVFCLVAFTVFFATACSHAADASRAELIAQIEKAIAAGASFLVSRQESDGTWLSQTYGLLKDGTSLTPLVLPALPDSKDCVTARERGLAAMSKWVDTDSRAIRLRVIPQYPVYTASLSLGVLAKETTADRRYEALAWRRVIATHQLDEQNGWSIDDSRFGGWGYSHERPLKPEPDAPLSPLDEPNLSATVFALEGLTSADPQNEWSGKAKDNALRFVERCQNWRDNSPESDAKFNDGGFHFMLGDDVRNKPGIAGTDSTGQSRFFSYGSATADGLRALLLCGLKPDHPRVAAARRWLIDHFDDGSHPGAYPAERRHLQPSLDFYYAASVARAFRLAPMPETEPLGRGRWAEILADRLIARQKDDGSWSNPAVDVREDDPLIATSLSLRALQLCREAMK